MLDRAAASELREAHREFERARARVWLERVRVGLDYRRAMREIDERVARVRLERDGRVRAAVADGASYREVARALGLSHSRVQQIVNEGAKGASRAAAKGPAR
jgi:DNA invertase Pin-like site-specific DNA recombinase